MAAVSRQVEFQGEDGERYPVALTVNALCGLEEHFGGKSISAIGEEIASGRAGVRGVRALFRAALLEGHPEIEERDAGRLLDDLGADRSSEIIIAAFENVQAGLVDGPTELPKADERGRLALEVAGERMTLVFGHNAQAELEQYFEGLQPEEIAHKIAAKEITLRDLRAMFRAALVNDRDLSLEQAGLLMDRVGIRVAGSAVAAAFVAAFPVAADDLVSEPEGNRQQRRAAKSRHPTRQRPKAGTGKP